MKKITALFVSIVLLTLVFTACTPSADIKSSPSPTVAITPSALPTQTITLAPTPTKTVQPASTAASTIVYKNTTYGFSFTLPKSWSDYKIITSKWEGTTSKSSAVTGPMISIRHPLWTTKDPRQDIPIMVFTLSQWKAIEHSYPNPDTANNSYPPNQEDITIGAAPVGPAELGRNSKYVFALPARYNYAFPTGYEEVEQIMSSKPLKAN